MLTADKYFLGEKSSKVQPFSLTFAHPITQISSSKSVDITFQLFQNKISSNLKLVIETSGDYVNTPWYGINVSKLTAVTKLWNKVTFRYVLPTDFRKGEIVKIYLYNPDLDEIYLDDFKIKFNRL